MCPTSLWFVSYFHAFFLLAAAYQDSGIPSFSSSTAAIAFRDPGIPPPSYIFAAGQLRPPYDLNADAMEPFAGCNARFASLCSVQQAIRLVTRAKIELCPRFAQDSAERGSALADVTAGNFEVEGATGFGLTTFLPNGTILADHLEPHLIGTSLDGYLAARSVHQPWLLDYIQWVVDWAGGFVPLFSTRFEDVVEEDNSTVNWLEATMYVESCPTGERLGVIFGHRPLPPVSRCFSNSNEFCAIQNLNSIQGFALASMLRISSAKEWSRLLYEVMYGSTYQVGDFYVYMEELSWIGYPGPNMSNPSPLKDTTDTIMAHGTLPVAIGNSVSELVPGTLLGIPKHVWLTRTVNNAGWTGGAIRDYPWTSSSGDLMIKMALVAGVVWNGTGYLAGSGTANNPGELVPGFHCELCTANYSLACAAANVKLLISHARTNTWLPATTWDRLTYDPWFGASHEQAYVNNYTGTWLAGFSVVAVSYNGTVVADGRKYSNVGRSVVASSNGDEEEEEAVFESASLHDDFILAAESGGGWVASEERVYFCIKVNKNEESFYLASSFAKVPYPLQLPCSAAYSSYCSYENAESLVGRALSDIFSAATLGQLLEAVRAIHGREGAYSDAEAADFSVQLLRKSDLGCPEFLSNASLCAAGLAEEVTASVRTFLADTRVGWAYSEDFSFYLVDFQWKPLGFVDPTDLVLISVIGTPLSPTHCLSDDECPDNSVCTEEELCECATGFMTNITVQETSCGTDGETRMECVDVRGLDCTTTFGGHTELDLEACRPCSPGYFCPSGTPTICITGRYCPEGSWTPISCPAGSFGNDTGLTECFDCPIGSISAQVASRSCMDCLVGTFAASMGQSACDICPVGTYGNETGQDSCLTCASGVSTETAGSTSEEDCASCDSDHIFRNGSCLKCPWGMSVDDGGTFCNVRMDYVVVTLSTFAAIVLGACSLLILLRIYKRHMWRLQDKADKALDADIKEGFEMYEDFGHPITLMEFGIFEMLEDHQLQSLHEGNRESHRLTFIDSITSLQELKSHGVRVIYFSYQWTSWRRKGASPDQWQAMVDCGHEIAQLNGWDLDKLFVWVDIFSMPQEHAFLRALALNSMYNYVKAADAFVAVCPHGVHQNTGKTLDRYSFQSRVRCKAEVIARCAAHGLQEIYIYDDMGLSEAPLPWVERCASTLFEGEMIGCCRGGHEGLSRCDKQDLVLPFLGLYYEGIRGTGSHAGHSFFRDVILRHKDAVFPRYFRFELKGGASEKRELFGGLLRRLDSVSASKPKREEPRLSDKVPLSTSHVVDTFKRVQV